MMGPSLDVFLIYVLATLCFAGGIVLARYSAWQASEKIVAMHDAGPELPRHRRMVKWGQALRMASLVVLFVLTALLLYQDSAFLPIAAGVDLVAMAASIHERRHS